MRKNLHLILFRQLLQHIRQPLILQLVRNLKHALIAHLVDGIRKVGGAGILVVGDERGRLLRLKVGGKDRLVPVHHQRLLRPAPPAAAGFYGTRDKQLRNAPVAVTALLNGHILNHGIPAAVKQPHPAIKELPNHQHLRITLLKTAQVHQARRNNLRRLNAAHPGHRHEHTFFAQHLNDDAHHHRLVAFRGA